MATEPAQRPRLKPLRQLHLENSSKLRSVHQIVRRRQTQLLEQFDIVARLKHLLLGGLKRLDCNLHLNFGLGVRQRGGDPKSCSYHPLALQVGRCIDIRTGVNARITKSVFLLVGVLFVTGTFHKDSLR